MFKSVIKKSATMTNHLQITDDINNEDQIMNESGSAAITSYSVDASYSSLLIGSTMPDHVPINHPIEATINSVPTQNITNGNKIDNSRYSLNRIGILNYSRPKNKIAKGKQQVDKILSWVNKFYRLGDFRNLDEIEKLKSIQRPKQRQLGAPSSSAQSFEYDDQLIIHPRIYGDQTFFEEDNQKKLFFQEISNIITMCIEKNNWFNDAIDIRRFVSNYEELNFDAIQEFVRCLIKEVNDKNSYFSNQMKLKKIYKGKITIFTFTIVLLIIL